MKPDGHFGNPLDSIDYTRICVWVFVCCVYVIAGDWLENGVRMIRTIQVVACGHRHYLFSGHFWCSSVCGGVPQAPIKIKASQKQSPSGFIHSTTSVITSMRRRCEPSAQPYMKGINGHWASMGISCLLSARVYICALHTHTRQRAKLFVVHSQIVCVRNCRRKKYTWSKQKFSYPASFIRCVTHSNANTLAIMKP